MSSIKNIIFDLGGVLLSINPQLTIDAFKNLGIKNPNELFLQKQQSQFFKDFEQGKITATDFRNEIKKLSAKPLTDEQIDAAWNAMLLELPQERIQLLQNLKKKHRLFLLSNTNEIHIHAFEEYLARINRKEFFYELFEKVYYSFWTRILKPDAAIFKLVLAENNLQAQETLFIDDSPQHVEGAKKVGLNALLLEKGKTILDLSFSD